MSATDQGALGYIAGSIRAVGVNSSQGIMGMESFEQQGRVGWRGWWALGGWLCAAGQLLTGHALVKLGLLSVAVVLLGADARRRGLRLTSSGMILGGAVLFCVCYLWCPYWTITMPPEAAGRWVTLGGLVILGGLWCGCFARRVEAPGCGAAFPKSALLAVMLMLVLVGGGLFAPLEWRGDEDYHLARLWALADSWAAMPAGWVLPLGLALCAASLWNPGGRMHIALRCVLVFGSLGVVTWSMGQTNGAGRLDWMLRRYPVGLLWLQAAVSWHTRGWSQVLKAGPELARLLPMLSLVGMAAWWASQRTRDELGHGRASVVGGALIVLALTTVPVLQCYGAGIYLEMPMVLLMIWVCTDADRLIDGHLRGDVVGASWIALAVIPFMKETALVFCLALLVFAVWPALFAGCKGIVSWWSLAGRFVRLAVVVLLPIGVYLYFRAQGPSVRPDYEFHASHFLEPALYRIMAEALWKQCGLLLVLAATGAVVAVRGRPRQVGFCLIVMLGYLLLFCGSGTARVEVDGVLLPGFLGHARFMLHLVPPLTALAWHAVAAMGRLRPAALLVVMAICVAGNVWMSPLRANGMRMAAWADTLSDTQGHQYPYPQLYEWFADTVGDRPSSVGIIGRRYAYDIGDAMYGRRFGLKLALTSHPAPGPGDVRVGQPLMSLETLAGEFARAAETAPQYIVIHQPVFGPVWDDRPTVGQYGLAQTFGGVDYRLIVYQHLAQRDPGQTTAPSG